VRRLALKSCCKVGAPASAWHNESLLQPARERAECGTGAGFLKQVDLPSSVVPLRQSAVESSLKQAAFEHLPVAAICINASGQILAANAGVLALVSVRADEVVGRHLSEFLTFKRPRDAARRWSRLWLRLQEGNTVRASTIVTLADGRRLPLRLDAETLRFENESVAAITLSDISAQRAAGRAETALQAQRVAMAHGPGGAAWLIGADRRVVNASAAPEIWPDLQANEVLGVPFDLLLDESASVELRSIVEQFAAQAGPDVRDCVWHLRSNGAGGAARWLGARLTNRLFDRRLRAVVIVGEDASARIALQSRASLLEQRLIAFASYSTDLLMVLDVKGIVRYQSPAIVRTLGLTQQDFIGRHGSGLAVPEDQHQLEEAISVALQINGTRAAGRRVRIVDAAGRAKPFWVMVRDCSGEPAIGGLMLTAAELDADTTVPEAPAMHVEAPAVREARRVDFQERLLDLAIHTRGDLAQSLSQTLRMCAETLGAASASFWRLNQDPVELRCEAHYDLARERFSRDWIGAALSAASFPAYFAALRDRQPVVVADMRASPLLHTATGDARWTAARATLDAPVLLDGGVHGVLRVQDREPRAWDSDEIGFVTTAALLVALALEASQRQEAEIRIEQLAWYDPLTGLPNRNLLRESMRDMIMTASNRDRRIAVMLIDLDRFKDVNDTLGHLVGDALIKSAALVLKETVGEAGIVARLGGDEFVVLLEQFEHRQEVALLAARIAQALHRTDLVPNVDTQVSASIGVALFPEHGREISTLLKNADAAMYQAKRDGRNQFSFFNPIRAERAAREVQLGIQLLKALQGDAAQFCIEYQPVVHMTTGRVVGLEALIRWQHPTFGLLTPDRFIGVAEVSGLSERITRWVVNEVCSQIKRWREKRPGFDIPVAINVAGRELGSSVLPLIVRGALAKHAIEPRMITLEITERTLVRENEINNDVMQELAGLGVGLVLDDFGTGYSMLGYLKRMPISMLKIDRSFVAGLPHDADSCAIVHAMLAVARHFRLKVVAEGIELAEQVEYLRSIGCDFAQGFFYSRPLMGDSIVDHIDLPPLVETGSAGD
jgi:diguanylate cyclase (GGDEF)-like protein/PAS domain S-box-containing protein